MSNDEDDARRAKIVEAAVSTLCEHFEAVQILVSHTDHNGTESIYRGHGNFYARIGMAREFVNRDSQGEQAAFIANAISPPEE